MLQFLIAITRSSNSNVVRIPYAYCIIRNIIYYMIYIVRSTDNIEYISSLVFVFCHRGNAKLRSILGNRAIRGGSVIYSVAAARAA